MNFGKKDDKEPETNRTIPPGVQAVGGAGVQKIEAFLGRGSKVTGTLNFTGPVELDGYIEGEIHSQDKLTIGEAAVVNARIVGSEILIKGTVTGDITASKRLALRKPARVVGNISSTIISIEEGVIFEGKCVMGNPSDSKVGQPKPISTQKVSASA